MITGFELFIIFCAVVLLFFVGYLIGRKDKKDTNTKYIDADKLIHDLEERIFAYSEGYAEGDDKRKDAIETLLKDVKYQLSVQQEYPDVDLEKEIDKEWKKCNPVDEGMGVESAYMDVESFDMIVRHFYKRGAEQFAKIVRANLSEIGKDAQSQFEQLYFEITGNTMYGGYKD